MFHYPFHVGDYLLATVHLSETEDLAYRRLLDLYYQTEGLIPLETQWVSRRIRMGCEVVSKVLEEFFDRTENGWKNERCELELAKYRAHCERNRVNGKLGGRPKKTQSVPSGNPVVTQIKPTRKPTVNQEPLVSSSLRSEETTAPRIDIAKRLVDRGVPESVARDWIAMRTGMKARPTETSIAGIEREATKAGLTLAEALAVCCAQGWRGFKAHWERGETRGATPMTGRQAAVSSYAQQAAEARGEQLDFIDGEAKRA